MHAFFKYTIILLIVIVCTTLGTYPTFAEKSGNLQTTSSTPIQEEGTGESATSISKNPYDVYNPNSIKPIPEPHILFKKRVWREIYLKERKNRPFFTREKEITKFIIEGVEAGQLQPYTNDTLTQEMTKEQFRENLRSSSNEEGTAALDKTIANSNDDAGWGTQHTTRSTSQDHEEGGDYFLPNEITTLELMEDVIFDKVSSIFRHDVQSITLIIPADKFATGLRKPVATFKYKDLMPYLDSQPDAIWFNVTNTAGDMKMTEAIELRKFDSRIVKVDNPTDSSVEDIYNKTPKHHLQASQELAEELIELNWFLWEN